MAEQGTLYFIAGDPGRVLRAFREHGFTLDVVGTTRAWRQATVTCGEATLTLRLKTQHKDPAYFRRQRPLLLTAIGDTPAVDSARQASLLRAAEAIRGSIGLTANPGFAANDRLALALQLAANAVDGFFALGDGFFDCYQRPLLLRNGTSDDHARLPVLPAEPKLNTEFDIDWVDEPVSPSPLRVAERMFIMLAVGCRAMIENNPKSSAARMARLGNWFWTMQVAEELEPHEQKILNAEPGALSAEQIAEAMASFEAIVVLAWALRLADLPAHDEPVDPRALTEVLGVFSEDARFVIDSADVRCPHELREMADRIMAVHWRLNRFDQDAAPLDMAAMSAEAWFGDMDSGKLALIDNDLAIVGKPVAAACNIARQRCRHITLQRHRAINWLLGHHPVFSKVETST